MDNPEPLAHPPQSDSLTKILEERISTLLQSESEDPESPLTIAVPRKSLPNLDRQSTDTLTTSLDGGKGVGPPTKLLARRGSASSTTREVPKREPTLDSIDRFFLNRTPTEMSMGEMSMLRSITKSSYDRSAVSTASQEKRLEKLRRHEYEDESDEESTTSQPRVHSASAASQRRRSLVRQNEQALFLSRSNGSGSWEASLPPRSASAHSRTRNVLSSSGKRVRSRVATAVGGRTEARHSIPSAGTPAARSGLRYDADFDCYYDPASDQYYKVQAAE